MGHYKPIEKYKQSIYQEVKVVVLYSELYTYNLTFGARANVICQDRQGMPNLLQPANLLRSTKEK